MESNQPRRTNVELMESMPRLNNNDHALYPLYFMEQIGINNNRKLIDVPVCNLDCKYSCYTDLSVLNKQNVTECFHCRKKWNPAKNYVDLGLMQILRENRNRIKNKNYVLLEYNHTTFELKWRAKKETFAGRLGSAIA